MAKLRRNTASHRLERPYTRTSKYSKKNFIRGGFPHLKLVKFEMGDVHKTFDTTMYLAVTRSMNFRQNSLEAARTSGNRLLEKILGSNYFLKLRVFPFHVIREHSLASGAGADRLSTGMARPYGKAVNSAARLQAGQILMELRLDKSSVSVGRDALNRASKKLPCSCKVIVV
ncbi:MAG: 50S ribosomal protein L16 [Candidatus Woesearchaeota archaeon]